MGKSKHNALVPYPYTGIPVSLRAILYQFLCAEAESVFIDLCC